MISARDISLRRDGKIIIQDISVEVQPGKIHALIGPNGSGKSTALRAISGDTNFYEGEIFYNGEDVRTISIPKMATLRSVVSQSQRFALGFKVSEVLQLATRFHGDAESSNFATSAVNIESLLHRSVTSLSGGEQQRVAIAMALAQSTPFLLLDEPFSAQDVTSVARISKVLRELAELGIGILLVAHMREEELNWCDEVMKLESYFQ